MKMFNNLFGSGKSKKLNYISRFFYRTKLRKEREKLLEKREYLLEHGFPIVFNGKSYIDDRIAEITNLLNSH